MKRNFPKRKRLNSNFHKNPTGRKRAIVNNARKGAVPPDPWDDKPFTASDSANRHIFRLLEKGFDDETIRRKILNKHGIDIYDNNYATNIRICRERYERMLATRELKKRRKNENAIQSSSRPEIHSCFRIEKYDES